MRAAWKKLETTGRALFGKVSRFQMGSQVIDIISSWGRITYAHSPEYIRLLNEES
jgi:hypothetical protein